MVQASDAPVIPCRRNSRRVFKVGVFMESAMRLSQLEFGCAEDQSNHVAQVCVIQGGTRSEEFVD